MKKIVVVGGPGSGKSTLAEYICEKNGCTRIELDALYHKANWQPTDAAEFRGKVQAAMDAAPEGWVVDGGYRSQLD
jgi:adenylate kinase family enzyme